MRRDWDYVAFDDYRSDMAETAAQAAGIIEAMKEQKRGAERGMIAAVLAAGGRVVVSDSDRRDADRAVLKMERDEANGALILTAHI